MRKIAGGIMRYPEVASSGIGRAGERRAEEREEEARRSEEEQKKDPVLQ